MLNTDTYKKKRMQQQPTGPGAPAPRPCREWYNRRDALRTAAELFRGITDGSPVSFWSAWYGAYAHGCRLQAAQIALRKIILEWQLYGRYGNLLRDICDANLLLALGKVRVGDLSDADAETMLLLQWLFAEIAAGKAATRKRLRWCEVGSGDEDDDGNESDLGGNDVPSEAPTRVHDDADVGADDTQATS